MYPLIPELAATILIAGVAPPLDTTGEVPVTDVTPAVTVPHEVAVPFVVKNLPELPV
jgi:hypothetical protein